MCGLASARPLPTACAAPSTSSKSHSHPYRGLRPRCASERECGEPLHAPRTRPRSRPICSSVSTEAWAQGMGLRAPSGGADMELWGVMSMASDEELLELHSILYGPSPFSPLLKSMAGADEAAARLHHVGREGFIRLLEERFRFLAADSALLVRGIRPQYRDTLLAVRRRLGVKCPATLVTADLEAEIFLHLLQQAYLRASRGASTRALSNIHPGESKAILAEGDGMTAPLSAVAKWREAVVTPVRVGAPDILGTLGKIGGAVAVKSLGMAASERALGQFLHHAGAYEALACEAFRHGVAGAAKRAATDAAQQGMTHAAARYGAIRALSSAVTPAMWAVVVLDLLVKATGIDYGRVVRAVFALAQIRLVRTYGFTSGAK